MDIQAVSRTIMWPNRLLFGAGAAGETGAEAARLTGGPVLIVTDAGVAGAGLLEPVEASLRGAGLRAEVFDGCEPNPTDVLVADLAGRIRAGGFGCVVGVGGGSPVDAAKAALVAATHGGTIHDYDIADGGDERIEDRLPPLLALPTTAGTATEVSEAAVVTHTGADPPYKMGIISPHLIPRVSILDPRLTLTLPADLTAATGLDALSHALEALVSSRGWPFAEALALRAVEMIARALPAAFRDGEDLRARADMLMASTIAGLAVNHNLLGLCHAMAHQLTTCFGLPHGVANAVLLPHVMAFNLSRAGGRYAAAAKALGRETGGLSEREAAMAAIEAVVDLCRRVRLAPVLPTVEEGETRLESMVHYALHRDRCVTTNPRTPTPGEVADIYRRVFRGEAPDVSGVA
ncbi:MAG: iron-containing alcohol dehydrogenase [Nitrospinota bacterium]